MNITKKVIVSSRNPVKVKATREGFSKMFPRESFEFTEISVPSGVSAQPLTDQETLQGAMNRVRAAQQHFPEAAYWVGIEGGVEKDRGEMACFAWIVVQSPEKLGKSRTSTFYLPKAVVDLMEAGKELGEADDIVFGQSNSKQGMGASGLLTGGVIHRATFYEPAVVFALIPFKNPHHY